MPPLRAALGVLLPVMLLAPWQCLSAATVNLAPLLFFESSEQGHQLFLAGPLFDFTDEYTAIRPLFYHDDSQTDILYPLGHSTRERMRFIPIFSYTNEEDRENVNLLIFFYGRHESQRYGGVFPLYGRLDRRFGHDRIRFVLWPLYSQTTTNGIETYSVLWPVFRYSPGRELQVFPLWGYEETVNYRHDYILWPLFHFRRGAQHINAFIPFFYYSRGDAYWNLSILWPLFTFSRDFSPELTSANFPWPLLRKATGAYEELKFFPFYWTKTAGESYRMKIVLWPLYKREASYNPAARIREERTTILLLSKKSTLIREQAVDSQQTTAWPLWHRHTSGGRTLWYFPWLIPIHDEGFRRNYLPLLTLASGESTHRSSETNILWRTFRYARSGPHRSCTLSFLFSYKHGPGYSRIGFLSDLLHWQWGAPQERL